MRIRSKVLQCIRAGQASTAKSLTEFFRSDSDFEQFREKRYRQIDRALQALRRLGEIQFDTRRGWSAIGKEAGHERTNEAR